MASQKAIDSSKRLRYIRALERFHKSIVSYLSNQNEVTKEGFVKKCEKGMEYLVRVENTDLYKGDLQELEKLVKKILAYQESEEEIQTIKEDILYAFNQLDKTKNARKYKKEKHQNTKFRDWE